MEQRPASVSRLCCCSVLLLCSVALCCGSVLLYRRRESDRLIVLSGHVIMNSPGDVTLTHIG